MSQIHYTIFARQGDNPNFEDGCASLTINGLETYVTRTEVLAMMDTLQDVAGRMVPGGDLASIERGHE